MTRRRPLIGFLALAVLALTGCARSEDALQRVLETGALRVGMDASFPPFEYVDGEGNLVGFDVDLAREIAAHLGVEAHFVANLPYDGLYDALTARRVDVVISALYVDPMQTGAFAFSRPYFNAGQVLVVPDESEISRAEDLDGRMLAVEFGSEGEVTARTWGRRIANLTVTPCQSPAMALELVSNGTVDAALVDHVSALAGSGPSTSLRITGRPVTDEPYAIAMRREHRALLRAVEEALAELTADGTLERLVSRWFRTGDAQAPIYGLTGNSNAE